MAVVYDVIDSSLFVAIVFAAFGRGAAVITADSLSAVPELIKTHSCTMLVVAAKGLVELAAAPLSSTLRAVVGE